MNHELFEENRLHSMLVIEQRIEVKVDTLLAAELYKIKSVGDFLLGSKNPVVVTQGLPCS